MCLRKLIIICALVLSLFSCASRSTDSGFSAQKNYWHNQEDLLLQEKLNPLRVGWHKFPEREAARLTPAF